MINKKFTNTLLEAGFIYDPDLKIWTEIAWEEFNYNDGDEYENYILDVVSNATDCSVMSTELASKMKDWPSVYHLTPKRANLLRPFAEKFHGKRILEIGCGCGAITRFLAESGADVTAVEGSRRRACIARKRCYDLDNVEVICTSSEKLPDLGEFDYVLLIGVLEYAQSFLGENGQQKLLEWCRGRLTQTGSLFIAIENKLGLKYLSGAKEDHLGVPMLGINNAYSKLGVRTLGREELKDLIKTAGYCHIDEFLPFPDYKLPTLIVSPEGYSKKSKVLYPLVCESYHKDAQPSSDYTFSLEESTVSVWKNELSADLSNSFLMIASLSEQEKHDADVLAWYYSELRKNNKQKAIKFSAIFDDIEVSVYRMNGEFLYSEKYHQGESLWMDLVGIVNKHNWQRQQIVEWVKNWIDILITQKGSDSYCAWDAKLPPEFLDATPFNIIKTSAGYEIFDLELKSEYPLNLSRLIFRGLLHSFLRITSVSPTHDVNDYNIYELTKSIIADVFPDTPDDLCENCLLSEVELMRQIATVDTSLLYDNYKRVSFLVRNFLNDYRLALASIEGTVHQYQVEIQEYEIQRKEIIYLKEELLNYQIENRKMGEKLISKEAELQSAIKSSEWKLSTSLKNFTSKFKR